MRFFLCWILTLSLSTACWPLAEPFHKKRPLKGAATSAKNGEIQIPEAVANLVRPILDLRLESINSCGEPGASSRCVEGEGYDRERAREQKVDELLKNLSQQNSDAANEALVVLMCFYIGESQEETDAVIRHGRRMLKYLAKYRNTNPGVTGRDYPRSLFKEQSLKADDFSGAIRAIQKGWHSTADNPEG